MRTVAFHRPVSKETNHFVFSFFFFISHDGFFFFFFLFRNRGLWGEREGKHKRERRHWKQDVLKRPHNAGLVLWFGLSSLSWAEEWKRLSTGMSGVPSNGAGRVTGQWERGLQSSGLIFSWWTQPPAPQCSLIASAEPTYGLYLEAPNDRINSACREKGVCVPFFFLNFIEVKFSRVVVCRKCSNVAAVPPGLLAAIRQSRIHCELFHFTLFYCCNNWGK